MARQTRRHHERETCRACRGGRPDGLGPAGGAGGGAPHDVSVRSVVLPDDLVYDEHHQWARWEASLVRCGLTAYQTDAAGALVFVGLPVQGSAVRAGEEIGSVESGKWVSSLFAPVDGVVVAVNELLQDDPETVNRDPYGDGWIFVLRPSAELQGLTAAEYAAVIRREEAQDATRIREQAG